MTFSPQVLDASSGPPGPARRRALLVAGIVLVGLVARVGAAAWLGLNKAPEPGSDQSEYDAYAWNLAQGNGYRGPSPDVADPNHLTAYRPPLPSVLMAAIYAVAGHRYDAVRLVHCLLGAASVWLTYRIGRRAYGEAVGLLAAAGYAVYPVAVLQSGDILSEPLGVFLFLLFLDVCLAFGREGTWATAIGSGVVFGLALLTRANYVVMIPLFAVWAVVQFRGRPRMLLRAAAMLLIAGLVMTPWVVRNYRVFGEFIPFSTMGGSALLQGNNRLVVTQPPLYGYSVWDTQIDEYREGLQSAGDELERDRRAKAFAVEWLKENPDKWGFLLWQKFIRSWTPYLKDNPSAAHRMMYLATWGPILALFGVALIPTLVRSLKTRDPTWLLHLAVLHYVLNSVVFFANIRYRAPVDPICIVLAAWTVAQVSRRIWRPASDPRRGGTETE
ncbi:MAG: glycosyltransferase family 39 protein [Zavarzinella sp.]|nr:glycosyltransferase family 39 protein [Zavarzinella sp.]